MSKGNQQLKSKREENRHASQITPGLLQGQGPLATEHSDSAMLMRVHVPATESNSGEDKKAK